jgi:hypothetical protein
LFNDGLRLAAWATGYEDDYEYGVASAIYFFEVPSRVRSVRIKISYDGEANRSDIGDEIAGRVWIRRATIGNDYEEYYPSEGRYEDVDQPLYGDTFVLRARKRLEILRLSASDYADDGMMELHIVAEGRQRIDVKYIEVETYSYAPKVRVITRYYKDYTWQPWNQYAYWYFYTGPTYHFGDYYYVRYTYPRYHDNYIGIRFSFNRYLTGYYVRYPHYRHTRWTHVPRVSRGTRRTWGRGRLGRWTSSHNEARRGYVVTSARRSPVEVRKSRTQVRSVLSSSSRRSPSAVRTQPGKVVRSPSRRGTASTQTRSSSITDVKKRVTTPNVRRGTGRPPSSTTAPARSGTQSSTKSRRVESKTPVRTRSSTPSSRRSEPERKSRVTTRTAPQKQRTPPSSKQIKTKRDSVTSRRSETKKTEPQRKAPERKAPERKVEIKKKEKDDDDDDDDKKSKTPVKTTPSTRKSTIKKRKTR